MIKYKCPVCKAKLENPDSMVGQKDQCPSCDEFHTVPVSGAGIRADRKRMIAVGSAIAGLVIILIVWFCANTTSNTPRQRSGKELRAELEARNEAERAEKVRQAAEKERAEKARIERKRAESRREEIRRAKLAEAGNQPEPVKPTPGRPSEAVRRQVYYELVAAEDRARRDAGNDPTRRQRLEVIYKLGVIQAHGLPVEEVRRISIEGVVKDWPMP